MKASAPCGTYAGYQRHLRAGERACDPCREGRRLYQRQYRARPGRAALTAQTQAARRRALTRLTRMFVQEFVKLVDEQLRAGVERPVARARAEAVLARSRAEEMRLLYREEMGALWHSWEPGGGAQ